MAKTEVYSAMMEDVGDVRREIVVRPERPDDHGAVYRVNELAFGRRDEADLVDRLRVAGRAIISLVAEDAGEVVGHILFSPVSVKSSAAGCRAVGLAPMAVRPDRQRQGIGSFLVRRGLDECRGLALGPAVSCVPTLNRRRPAWQADWAARQPSR